MEIFKNFLKIRKLKKKIQNFHFIFKIEFLFLDKIFDAVKKNPRKGCSALHSFQLKMMTTMIPKAELKDKETYRQTEFYIILRIFYNLFYLRIGVRKIFQYVLASIRKEAKYTSSEIGKI